MKNKIIIGLLMFWGIGLFAQITYAQPAQENKDAPDYSSMTPEQRQQTIDNLSQANPLPLPAEAKNKDEAAQRAIDKTNTDELACQNNGYASCTEQKAAEAACQKEGYGSCANKAAIEAERQRMEAECKSKSFTNCAEMAIAQRNSSGSGFKLGLDFLTLTSNGQKSGKEPFQGKYSKQYGVLVGTILYVMDILVYIIGSFAFLTLVIAGILMITNHGEEAWVTKGKTMMLYSILGILVALLSFAIVNVIETALA